MSSDFSNELIELLPRLRRFARSLTGKADEADDLVQAACERALRGQASFKPETRLDAWLFRIMKNLWIDRIRRRKTEGVAEPIDDSSTLAGTDGRDVTDARLTLDRVWLEMGRLPEEQQQVLRLVCVDNMSYKDVADQLQIPIGTVMSRLSRARTSLNRALQSSPYPATHEKTGGRP